MSQLMTRWLCICQEGPTVDNRLIKREWIIEAAELYDASVYTAEIWPEHERWYGSLGHVLEVKAEEDGEGIMRLYARLCPEPNLIHAVKGGQLVFSSAEFTPDGDWRGTGKSYLEGLGVTNSPASVGTTRLQFNKGANSRFSDYRAIAFDELAEISEEDKKLPADKNKPTWRSLFNLKERDTKRNFAEDTSGGEQTPSSDDKVNALAEVVDEIETTITSLNDAVDKLKTVMDTKEFADLRDNLPKILSNFKKMEELITKEPDKNPAGGSDKDFQFL